MHTAALPARELNSSLSLFQKLLLVNTLREDMLELSVIQFVENALGRRYIEPTNVTLEGCFEDTSPTVPTIFILSPAADPTQLQLAFDMLVCSAPGWPKRGKGDVDVFICAAAA